MIWRGAVLLFEAADQLGVEGEVDVYGEVEQDQDVDGLAVERAGDGGLAEDTEAAQREADGDRGGDGEGAADAGPHVEDSDTDVGDVTAQDGDEDAGGISAVGGDEEHLGEGDGVGEQVGCEQEVPGDGEQETRLEELEAGDEDYGSWPVYSSCRPLLPH